MEDRRPAEVAPLPHLPRPSGNTGIQHAGAVVFRPAVGEKPETVPGLRPRCTLLTHRMVARPQVAKVESYSQILPPTGSSGERWARTYAAARSESARTQGTATRKPAWATGTRRIPPSS